MSQPELVATANFGAAHRKLTAVQACTNGDGEVLIGLMNAYLDAKGKKGSKTSAATRKTYETGLLRWLLFCWPNRIDDPSSSPRVRILRATEDDIEDFRTAREDAGNAPQTVAAYLAAVRTLYNALVWAKAIERSPATDVRSPSDPRPAWERNSAVSWSDYKKLLAYCETRGGALMTRNIALVRLLGDVGLRIAEACALQVDDIDLERRQLTVQKGKGNKKRTVAMTAAATEALRVWLRRRLPLAATGERRVIINIGRDCNDRYRGRGMSEKSAASMLNRLYLAAGLPPDTSGAHTLRHTAGTRIHQRTKGNLQAVARQLGHDNINTSAIYAKFSLDDMHQTMRLLDDEEEDKS